MGLRIGVDIGGTFTDVAIHDSASDTIFSFKSDSDQVDPAAGVLNALVGAARVGAYDLSEVIHLAHGTTLGVNTLLQRSGAIVGALVTRGFRDLFELARLRIPRPNEFTSNRTRPLVPRELVREIDARLRADGSVLRPLQLDEVDRAVEELVERGAEAVAVCFLHSYRNPEHELVVADHVRRRFPDLDVASSAELWPEWREYERGSVAVMNAYIGRILKDYFGKLEAGLVDLGIRAPLLTTRSNGGVVRARTIEPIHTLLSGPAAGIIGAAVSARQDGASRVIAVDMGGTSADAAILDGRIPYSSDGRVGDFPVLLPTVDVSSIGAGGGSIAWCDSAGVLKVGPMSAGSKPGPCCYGRGGEDPTVTDAYVVLGLIGATSLLGGSMQVDRDAAYRSLEPLGRRLSMDARHVAAAVVEVVTANMYSHLAPLMARRGVEPNEFWIVPYGGAGPVQVPLLAEELGMSTVMIPSAPGTLCALGSLLADVRQDFVITIGQDLNTVSEEVINDLLGHLERRARSWIAVEALPVTTVTIERSADLRYKGQSFNLSLALSPGQVTRSSLSQGLSQQHQRAYGYPGEGATQVITLRLTVVGTTPKPPSLRFIAPTTNQVEDRPRERRVWLFGDERRVSVYDRSSLSARHPVSGPAIIEQYDSTTVVPPGWSACITSSGALMLEAG